MKNSTLLRLFFISIGLPLTCASSSSTSSSSTSSTLTSKSKPKTTSLLVDKTGIAPAVQLLTTTTKPKPKPKSKTTSLLVDTTGTAPAVQLKDQSILVQSAPEEAQVSGGDKQTERFDEVINKEQYKEMSDGEQLKHLYLEVTTLDNFKGRYEDLKQHKMVPDFLAHGKMAVVREVIVGTDLLETDGLGRCDSIYDAIALSLGEDRHKQVAGLLEAARERPDLKNKFDLFVNGFFARYPPEKNSMPLKRFLTLHGEELSKEHRDIFETICKELVWWLKREPGNLASHKLLIDLVGQPSLLAPVAFVGGFPLYDDDTTRVDFIKYGYKEAIKEGLKKKYPGGGERLWYMMVSMDPTQFSGEYPSTGEARAVALKDFRPTKQDREEAWAKVNTPIFSPKLVAELLEFGMPLLREPVPWSIIAEYAETGATWIDV